MSKLEQFIPELKAAPLMCKCGKPAKDKKGVTRRIGEKPFCRDCYGKKLGRAKPAEEKP